MKNQERTATCAGRVVIVATPNIRLRALAERTLQERNVEVEFSNGGAGALSRLESGDCWALLIDRFLPDLDADEVKNLVDHRFPAVSTWIVYFESGRIGFESGAETALLPSELSSLLGGFEDCQTSGCNPLSPFSEQVEDPSEPEPLPGMVGRSAAVRQIQSLVRLVAPRSTAVLLTGETGTGKELVAKAIHHLGLRAHRPFVVVNCAAIPDSLFESELFGYNRGAFTGAVESRPGRIEAANGGTLFLDEVGDLPLTMQAKLLRFLQEGEVQRLGSHDPCRVNARVIAATNADLETRVSKGLFREDLFYRLAVFPIDLDPLRDRLEDIGPLAGHFLDSFSAEAGVRRKPFSSAALMLLRNHRWPGNIRELKHATERAFILAGQDPILLPEHFSFLTRKAPERFAMRVPEKTLMLGS